MIVSGRLKQCSYETREGEKRTVAELEVDEIGPSLRYATATVKKLARGGGNSSEVADDPWGSAPPAGSGGGSSDDPPWETTRSRAA